MVRNSGLGPREGHSARRGPHTGGAEAMGRMLPSKDEGSESRAEPWETEARSERKVESQEPAMRTENRSLIFRSFSASARSHEPAEKIMAPFPLAFQVYAIPPSACRDEAGLREKEYDFPPPVRPAARPDVRPEGVYDIPPTSTKPIGKDLHVKYSCDAAGTTDLATRRPQNVSPNHPPSQLGQSLGPQNDAYDVPRGVQFLEPPAETSEKANPEERDGVYDVPLHSAPDTKGCQDVVDGINRLSFSSTGSTRSNMSTSSTTSKESSLSTSPSPDKRLLLDPDSAIERLHRLQQSLEMGVSSLLALVTTDWRCYGYMERHVNEIRASVDRVEVSVRDYLHFAKGAAANASCLPELLLQNKMKRELQRVEDSHQILSQTSHDLNECSWSLNILAVNKPQNKWDDLDRFVMVAKTVPDDAKQLTTTINTNAEALFRPGPGGSHAKSGAESITNSPEYPHAASQVQLLLPPGDPKAQALSKPLPPSLGRDQPPDCSSSDSSERSWMDDYDYVHLQVRKSGSYGLCSPSGSVGVPRTAGRLDGPGRERGSQFSSRIHSSGMKATALAREC